MLRVNAALTLLLFVLTIASPACAANWRMLRRAAQIGACVASATDALSTVAVMNSGGTETNPMLRSASGSVNYGRMIAIKATTCALPIVISEFMLRRNPHRGTEAGGIGGAGVGLAIYTWATFHNLGAEREMRRRASVAVLSGGVIQ